MKSRALIFLIVPFVLFQSCMEQSVTFHPSDKLAPANLIEDLELFRSKIVKFHPSLNYPHNRVVFEHLFDSVATTIKDSIRIKSFHAKMAYLASSLMCGHTRLSFPDGYYDLANRDYKHLPIRLFFTDSSIFVREVLSDKVNIPRGSRIISINGRHAKNIVKDWLSINPADGYNRTYKYWQINRNWFGVDLRDEFYPESYTLEVLSNDSLTDTSYFTAVLPEPMDTIVNFRNRIFPDQFDYVPYEYKRIDSLNTSILVIRDFISFKGSKFTEFLRNTFLSISKNQDEFLVLDVRGNDGGDPEHAAELYRYLISSPTVYFESYVYGYNELKSPIEPKGNRFSGQLIVLMNGGSYSTTGHLLSLLKFHKTGILIGEKSGGSFRCNGCYQNLILPYSKLDLLYPRCSYQTAVNGKGMESGVVPDVPHKPQIESIVKGNDLIMETALKIISEKSVVLEKK